MKCETVEVGETLNLNMVEQLNGRWMDDRREDHLTVRLVFFVIILLYPMEVNSILLRTHWKIFWRCIVAMVRLEWVDMQTVTSTISIKRITDEAVLSKGTRKTESRQGVAKSWSTQKLVLQPRDHGSSDIDDHENAAECESSFWV